MNYLVLVRSFHTIVINGVTCVSRLGEREAQRLKSFLLDEWRKDFLDERPALHVMSPGGDQGALCDSALTLVGCIGWGGIALNAILAKEFTRIRNEFTQLVMERGGDTDILILFVPPDVQRAFLTAFGEDVLDTPLRINDDEHPTAIIVNCGSKTHLLFN